MPLLPVYAYELGKGPVPAGAPVDFTSLEIVFILGAVIVGLGTALFIWTH